MPADEKTTRAEALPELHGFPPPPGGWVCFHCGEKFTNVAAARDHFGATLSAEPGCQIKVRLGAERGLLRALRETEATLARFQDDDTPAYRAMAEQQSRHAEALRTAEEAGYERGLRDGRLIPEVANG